MDQPEVSALLRTDAPATDQPLAVPAVQAQTNGLKSKRLSVNTSAPIDYLVGLNDAHRHEVSSHQESVKAGDKVLQESTLTQGAKDKGDRHGAEYSTKLKGGDSDDDADELVARQEALGKDPRASGSGPASPSGDSLDALIPLVTDTTRVSELRSVSLETVGALGGWTAKRVSVTGQLFFERDADGKISLARPPEALAAVRLAEEEDETPMMDTDSHIAAAVPPLEQPLLHTEVESENRTLSLSVVDHEEEAEMLGVEPLLVDYLSDKPEPLLPESVAKIQAQEGNDRCGDCGAGQPTWASLSFGVLLCVGCSGAHRSWGSHVSVVKSLTLDNWTAEQLAFIHPFGGNARFRSSVKADGIKPSARYATEEAARYRARLRAAVKKEPMPPTPKPLLVRDSPAAAATTMMMMTMNNNMPSPSGSNSGSSAGLAMLAAGASPQTPRRNAKMQQESKEATACLVCGRSFTVVVRKYICKNCERAVCARCAPGANTKPLPHLGLGMTPQRHCFRCYRSPFIDWSHVGLSSAELAAEAQVSAESSSSATSTPMQRRKTLSDKKAGGVQPRRKTLGEAIAGLMKRG